MRRWVDSIWLREQDRTISFFGQSAAVELFSMGRLSSLWEAKLNAQHNIKYLQKYEPCPWPLDHCTPNREERVDAPNMISNNEFCNVEVGAAQWL